MKLIFPALVGFLSLLRFCEATNPGQDVIFYKVRVDSIQVASSVKLGDTIVVRFFGTISPDGCSSFLRFEDSLGDQTVDLLVWAQRKLAPACPLVMVYLDGKVYRFVATKAGQVTIIIHQPDGTTFQRHVQVT